MSQRPVVYETIDRPPQCPSRNTSACGRPVVYLQPEILASAAEESATPIPEGAS